MVASRLPRRFEAWLRISATAAAVVLLIVSVSLGATLYSGALLVLFVGVVVQVSGIPLSLVQPWLGAPLSVAGSLIVIVSASGGTFPWPWSVTTMITQALVLAVLGYRAVWLIGAGALVIVVTASAVIAPIVAPSRDPQNTAINLIVFTFVGGVMLAAGMVTREWQVITGQLASERRHTEDERARRLVAEEKTRIARELHDVIAHSMSIISVQATSAPFRHPQADAPLRQEFDEIAASSRRALAEMRSLLGVLRDPDAPAVKSPQPHLSDIRTLVAKSRRSGLAVELHGADALDDTGVDDGVGLSAYRIVQEALSNVIRHAPGASVDVHVDRERGLDLLIVNQAGTSNGIMDKHHHEEHTAGSGLRGMQERAASVGGRLVFGPVKDGGYEVHAVLPLDAPRETASAR